MGHSLAGVWIEIIYHKLTNIGYDGHSLAGVWIEIRPAHGTAVPDTRSLPCGSVD